MMTSGPALLNCAARSATDVAFVANLVPVTQAPPVWVGADTIAVFDMKKWH